MSSSRSSLAQNHPGRELRKICKQPKLQEPPQATWQPSLLPEALPGCSAAPKSPPLPRAWAWPPADTRARDEALRRRSQGCVSKPAQRNPFWGETGIRALQHDSNWGLRRGWIKDWGRERTQFWDLTFRLWIRTFLLRLVYPPYDVFRGSLTRRGVSKERWRETAGFGFGRGEPSDAKSSSPGFLHVSGTILIRGPCLLPPASNWSWGSYDTSQGRNSDQTHLKH